VIGTAPKVEAQLGNLQLNVLLDSGSTRSLISLDHFQSISRGNPKLQLLETEVICFTASDQSLKIVGDVKVPLKIHGFSCMDLLVSRILRSQPILGADFISKTRMVLELGREVLFCVCSIGHYQVPSG